MEANTNETAAESSSDDDNQMEDLDKGDEGNDESNEVTQILFDLEAQEEEDESLAVDDDSSLTQTQSEHGTAATVVSGSPQDVNSCRE